MMPSLRKKVAGFIRQLSVNNQSENVTDQNSSEASSGCFIQKYLSGNVVRQNEPVILHGRNPHELPRKILGSLVLGPHSVLAAVTGPDGGLTTVNRRQRHLSTSDPDVDYIDILEQQAEQERNTVSSSDCIFSRSYGRWFTIRPPIASSHPIDNSVMHIRAAGSVFSVGKRSVHTSVSDLKSLAEGDYKNLKVPMSIKTPSIDFKLTKNDLDMDRDLANKNSSKINDLNLNYEIGTGTRNHKEEGGFTDNMGLFGLDDNQEFTGHEVFQSSMCITMDNKILNINSKGSQSGLADELDFSSVADVLKTDPSTGLEPNGNDSDGIMFHSMINQGDDGIDEDFVIPPPAEYATNNFPTPGFTPIRKSKSAPPPLSGRVTSTHHRGGKSATMHGTSTAMSMVH